MVEDLVTPFPKQRIVFVRPLTQLWPMADVTFSDDSARIQKEQTGYTSGIVRVGLKQPGSP